MRNFEAKYYIDGVETDYPTWDKEQYKDYTNQKHKDVISLCHKYDIHPFKVYQEKRYTSPDGGGGDTFIKTNLSYDDLKDEKYFQFSQEYFALTDEDYSIRLITKDSVLPVRGKLIYNSTNEATNESD